MISEISQILTPVEEALRAQAEVWQKVAERTTEVWGRVFPLENPRRILIFGVGSSHHAARLIASTIHRDKSRTRLPVIACSSMEIGVDIIPQRTDWAFAISHRGKTGATLEALKACKRAGAFTVLVGSHEVEQPDFADYLMKTCEIEKVEPHTISMTSAVCAVTTFLLGSKVKEEWDSLVAIPSPNLEVLQRRLGQGPSLVVGEWEGEWLARECALKLMEMARIPVRSYGTEEFFHGPTFCMTESDRIWHVSHGRDQRGTELRSSYRFDIHGSTPLAWVPALVEMQWAALAVAANRCQR